jgi:hypothetical protein
MHLNAFEWGGLANAVDKRLFASLTLGNGLRSRIDFEAE